MLYVKIKMSEFSKFPAKTRWKWLENYECGQEKMAPNIPILYCLKKR